MLLPPPKVVGVSPGKWDIKHLMEAGDARADKASAELSAPRDGEGEGGAELSAPRDGEGEGGAPPHIISVTEAVNGRQTPEIPRRKFSARPTTIRLSQAETKSSNILLKADVKCHSPNIASYNSQNIILSSSLDDGKCDALEGVVVETLIVPTGLPSSPDTPITPLILSESDKDSGIGFDLTTPLPSSTDTDKSCKALSVIVADELDTTDASEISDEESSSNIGAEALVLRPKSPFERKIWNRRNGRFKVRGNTGKQINYLDFSARDGPNSYVTLEAPIHEHVPAINDDHSKITPSKIQSFCDSNMFHEKESGDSTVDAISCPTKNTINAELSSLKLAIARMRVEVAEMTEETMIHAATDSEEEDDDYNGYGYDDYDFCGRDTAEDMTEDLAVEEWADEADAWTNTQSLLLGHPDHDDYGTDDDVSCDIYTNNQCSFSSYTTESESECCDQFSDNEKSRIGSEN